MSAGPVLPRYLATQAPGVTMSDLLEETGVLQKGRGGAGGGIPGGRQGGESRAEAGGDARRESGEEHAGVEPRIPDLLLGGEGQDVPGGRVRYRTLKDRPDLWSLRGGGL